MNENILIIEDDVEMAQVLQQGLEDESYSVLLARNGGKGLEMARTGLFQAIILDVMLPVLGTATSRWHGNFGPTVSPLQFSC